jgi:hypothetical protein
MFDPHLRDRKPAHEADEGGEPDFQDLAIFWSLNGYMMVFGCLY